MRRNLALLFGALALPLAIACGDSNPAAPELDIEDVSDTEAIVTADHLASLSDEQRAAVRAAFAEAHQAIARILRGHRAGDLTREEAHALARQVHDALLQKLSTILTPEQLDALRNGPHHRPDSRPDPLQLTEEQKAQILALSQALGTFVRDLRSQLESGQITAGEARAQLRAAVQRFNASVCGLLTADQQSRAPFCSAGATGQTGRRG